MALAASKFDDAKQSVAELAQKKEGAFHWGDGIKHGEAEWESLFPGGVAEGVQMGQLSEAKVQTVIGWLAEGGMSKRPGFDILPNMSPFSTLTPGHPLLMPLTSSLYVTGTIAATDRVTIDIGTGYFVEVGVDGVDNVHQCG